MSIRNIVIKSLFYFYFFVALHLPIVNTEAQTPSSRFLDTKPMAGDGILSMLGRYLILDSCSRSQFLSLNDISGDDALQIDKNYQLPIMLFDYNGKSIRSTIGINDYTQAKEIEKYNDHLLKGGLKNGDYRKGDLLWVPSYLLDCYDTQGSTVIIEEEKPEIIEYPIFGKEFEKVEIKDKSLENKVYYIVSGHAGPDPGAIGNYKDQNLCEDEYAYDVALRLARNLLAHSAKVYIIIQDADDGIRSEEVLACDEDELAYGDKKIPYNQVKRLKQRADVINTLYKQHKKEGISDQKLLVLHVDSRQVDERVDMFFYHSRKSKTGKKLANHLYEVINMKYGQHQTNRGYFGSVKTRELYMVRRTLPVSVYIELGNIQNTKDQKRFVLESNRQAIADWLSDGLIGFENE